jgi:hypothetical protein
MLCSGSLDNFCISAKVKSRDLGTRTNSFVYIIEHLSLLVLEIQDANSLTQNREKKKKKKKKRNMCLIYPIVYFQR